MVERMLRILRGLVLKCKNLIGQIKKFVRDSDDANLSEGANEKAEAVISKEAQEEGEGLENAVTKSNKIKKKVKIKLSGLFTKQSTTANILGFTSAFFALLILVSLFMLSSSISEYENIKSKQLELTRLSYELELACKHFSELARSCVGSGDMTYEEEYMKLLEEDKVRENIVDELESYGLNDEEIKLLDQVISISDVLISQEKTALSYMGSETMEKVAGDKLYGGSQMEAMEMIEVRLDNFDNAIIKRTDEDVAKETVKTTLITIISVFIGLVLLVFSFTNIVVTRIKVIRPIKRLSREVKVLSEGRLTEEMNTKKDDSEIGQLATEMDRMRIFLSQYIQEISFILKEISNKNLNLTVTGDYIGDFGPIKGALLGIISSLNNITTEIYRSADGVTMGAQELSAGAQQLSEGAVTQAEATERLLSNIKMITAQAEDNSSSASHGEAATKATKSDAMAGKDKMDKMLEAIDIIRKSSEEVSGIIKTIDNIAFETNILAINASIEAARVGAMGKGFAVVASEVRSLADKSAAAAKSSDEIISKTLKNISSGTVIAKEAVAQFNKIVGDIEKIAETMTSISTSSQNQVSAAVAISNDVSSVSDVATITSATAEESYAAGSQLLLQAKNLQELVAEFTMMDAQA